LEMLAMDKRERQGLGIWKQDDCQGWRVKGVRLRDWGGFFSKTRCSQGGKLSEAEENPARSSETAALAVKLSRAEKRQG
jgi:hypothetical protein